MKPVLIFRHVDCEGPGFLAEYLDRERVPWELVAVDQGEPVPRRPDGASALVFMGGPMSVNDPLDWVRAELDLIRRAADAGLPLLGHCLGGQLISKALGGEVGPNPVREIGWHPVACRNPDSRWLQGLPAEFLAFHWHGESFSLPDGAELLLGNAHCAHQAFALGNILALQCHVEMTAPLVREWTQRYANELSSPSGAVQSAGQMTADLDARIAGLQAIAEPLYARWLQALAH